MEIQTLTKTHKKKCLGKTSGAPSYSLDKTQPMLYLIIFDKISQMIIVAVHQFVL